MNEVQIAGIAVLSIVLVLVFWKFIQQPNISEGVSTILCMIGFFAGMGWSLFICAYLCSKHRWEIPVSEWRTCVSICGVFTIFGFIGAIAIVGPLRFTLDVYVLITLISTLITLMIDTWRYD